MESKDNSSEMAGSDQYVQDNEAAALEIEADAVEKVKEDIRLTMLAMKLKADRKSHKKHRSKPHCTGKKKEKTALKHQLKRRAQMYDIHSGCSVPNWSIDEKADFLIRIRLISVNLKKKKLEDEISELGKKSHDLSSIAKLKRDIRQLPKKLLHDIVLPLDEEYDWKALADSLNGKHNERECQAFWKFYLHPAINRSSWTIPEHQELKRIASAYKKNQDWDQIAKGLNTKRTGYQCCVYFHANIAKEASNIIWTHEDKKKLRRVVKYCRVGEEIDWKDIGSAFENHTKKQVYNIVQNMLIVNQRGQFLDEEDKLLQSLYHRYRKSFRKIAQFFPDRTEKQLKKRFHILTNKEVPTAWTVEDDRNLLEAMASMPTRCYARIAHQFPGKDRARIRARHVILMKWKKTHPGCDVSGAPRRALRNVSDSESDEMYSSDDNSLQLFSI